jgi:hypothetical protein
MMWNATIQKIYIYNIFEDEIVSREYKYRRKSGEREIERGRDKLIETMMHCIPRIWR